MRIAIHRAAANPLSGLAQAGQLAALNQAGAGALNAVGQGSVLSGLSSQSQTVLVDFETADLPKDLQRRWFELVREIGGHLSSVKRVGASRAGYLTTLGLTPEDIGE